MLKKKRQYADPSTRPDYPLGPHHQPPHPSETAAAAVVVPPALMLPTASPHVFVAKVACQEANISARHLFASVDSNNNYKKKYRYEYFPPATFQRTFPSGKQPEVAFLGRSNVGKSSLMNALMRQPLAVTSKQPGRTQQAYYYGCIPTTNVASIGSHSLKSNAAATATGFLVDLPGYGYAVGPDSAVGSWQAATQDFLLQRRDTENLRRVFVLQDSRLRAPQAIDDIVVTWLEEADIAYTIVLTKADDSHLTAGVVKHVNLCSMRYQQLWSDATPTTATVHDHDDGKYTGQNVTEEEEEDDDQNQGMGVIMMSPIVHVTSAKKHTGIAEVLSSIETEFLADRLRATDQ